MFHVVVAWAIALGGLFMAVVCAVNCLGLARGWLRTGADPIGGLGLGMVSAGLAGVFWAVPINDEPFEAWRQYWMLLGVVGLILMVGKSDTLKILPIHVGRRPPTVDPATKF